MKIVTLNFEEPLTLKINDETVKVITFKTPEDGIVKFGIEAPRSVKVHREEIYEAIKKTNTD